MGTSTQTSRFFSGMDTLLSGHLSLSLVKKNVTEFQFVAFRQTAQAKGYMPVFPSFTQVFEFPVSYFVESGCIYLWTTYINIRLYLYLVMDISCNCLALPT